MPSKTFCKFRISHRIYVAVSIINLILFDGSFFQFQLPPIFNIPKSQLQCYGESVYCVGVDMLSKCNSGQSPIERFKGVLAWDISVLRPLIFGVTPYNPILGETHHVSRGTLNVLLEQVPLIYLCLFVYLTMQKL